MEDKRVLSFHKGISLKVNTLTQLEFELAYHNDELQHISHCATGTFQPTSPK